MIINENNAPKSSPKANLSELICTITIYLGLAVVFWGMLSFARGYQSRGGYYPAQFSELKPVYGTIEKIELGRSWGISITDKVNGQKYISNGYFGVENDLNKYVKILIGKNKIYQIEVDDIIKVSYLNRISNDEKDMNTGIKYILIGVVVLAVGVFVKIKSRRKN